LINALFTNQMELGWNNKMKHTKTPPRQNCGKLQ